MKELDVKESGRRGAIYFSFKKTPMKIEISPLSSWEKKIQWGTKAHQHGGEREENAHSVSFEPMSPCWVEFDIQAMRQGSTQGGRPPCNINSHLESSCGYEHETLKETAAMDPVPSHHLSHCLLKRPSPLFPKACVKKHTNWLLFCMKFPFWLQSLSVRACLGDVTNIWTRKSTFKASLSPGVRFGKQPRKSRKARAGKDD